MTTQYYETSSMKVEALVKQLQICDQNLPTLSQNAWRDNWIAVWLFWKQHLGSAQSQLRLVQLDLTKNVRMRFEYHGRIIAVCEQILESFRIAQTNHFPDHEGRIPLCIKNY